MGYIIHHTSHTKAIRVIHDYIGLCAPSVMQQALSLYLEQCNYGNAFIVGLRQNVKAAFETLRDVLLDLHFTIPAIDGGFFIWAKLPEQYIDGFEFASDLYDATGVAAIPGEHFSSVKVNWLRFNVARPIEEILLAGNRIAEFVNK